MKMNHSTSLLHLDLYWLRERTVADRRECENLQRVRAIGQQVGNRGQATAFDLVYHPQRYRQIRRQRVVDFVALQEACPRSSSAYILLRQTVDNKGKDNKYQLSLIGPRDKIVLLTELDDLCDKLQWSSVGARMYYKLS